MRKSILSGAMLFFAACGGGGGTTPLVTTTVVVTTAPTQISINETAQASAVVKDQNGNALSGKTITWESLNPSVATVSSAGSHQGRRSRHRPDQGNGGWGQRHCRDHRRCRGERVQHRSHSR